jgi:hypothetical protein
MRWEKFVPFRGSVIHLCCEHALDTDTVLISAKMVWNKVEFAENVRLDRSLYKDPDAVSHATRDILKKVKGRAFKVEKVTKRFMDANG